LDLSPTDTLTVQGDLQEDREGQNLTTVIVNQLPLEETFTERSDAKAAKHFLARWKAILSPTALKPLCKYTTTIRAASLQEARFGKTTVDMIFSIISRSGRGRMFLGLDRAPSRALHGPGKFDSASVPGPSHGPAGQRLSFRMK